MQGRTCLCSCCRSFSALSERGREGRNVNFGVSIALCRDTFKPERCPAYTQVTFASLTRAQRRTGHSHSKSSAALPRPEPVSSRPLKVLAETWELLVERIREAGRTAPRGPGRAAHSPVASEHPPQRLPMGCLRAAAAAWMLLAELLQQCWGREPGCLQRGPAAGASAGSAALPARQLGTLGRRPGCVWGVVRAGSGMVQLRRSFAA